MKQVEDEVEEAQLESAAHQAQAEIHKFSYLARLLIALSVLLVTDERLASTQRYLFQPDTYYLTRIIRYCVLFWPQIQLVLLVLLGIALDQKRRYHNEEKRLNDQVNNLLRQ